jgi:hypothetical protein
LFNLVFQGGTSLGQGCDFGVGLAHFSPGQVTEGQIYFMNPPIGLRNGKFESEDVGCSAVAFAFVPNHITLQTEQFDI